jgi:hypothetical protein
VGMHDRHFAEGIVAEIDRYSDRYRINRRANRVPLNSVLKLTDASFPVELLGQGGVSPLTYNCCFVSHILLCFKMECFIVFSFQHV